MSKRVTPSERLRAEVDEVFADGSPPFRRPLISAGGDGSSAPAPILQPQHHDEDTGLRCERRAKARGIGHSRPGSWDGSWDERQTLGGRRGPERPSKGPGRTLGTPQRTQAPGLRRRERRFESCRGHRLCLAQTAAERQARTQVEQLNGQYRPEKWSAERRSCWHSRGL